MYGRFTDRARKVMPLANEEALWFRHEYIATEHILLGLVREGSGVAGHVLKNLGMDTRKIRQEVERLIAPCRTGEYSPPSLGRMPLTPRGKRAIEYSIEEARSLNHNYVGTEHLLLGLLRESGGVAAAVLTTVCGSTDLVRSEVCRYLDDPKHGLLEHGLIGWVRTVLRHLFGG